MTVELVFLRHGRTAANASGLLLGRTDAPLDDVGERQAAAAAKALGPVDAVVASPLARTRRTAGFVAEAGAANVHLDERLLELDYGAWDGRPVHEVAGTEWAAWRADRSFAPPGGESLEALGARVREACDDWSSRATASGWSTVVLVSHVSPIKAAVAWALGVDDGISWRTFLTTASITRIVVGERGPSLHSFNETGHLSEHL